MAELFYYPKINASASVVNQALLYWDGLATVIPPGAVERYLDPRMREVHQAGLYRPLVADRWPADILLDDSILDALFRLGERIPPDDLIPGVSSGEYFHRAKISPALEEELIHRGLARYPNRGEFRRSMGLRVTDATQACLISLIARDIAARASRQNPEVAGPHAGRLYPFTDYVAAHRFAHEPPEPPESRNRYPTQWDSLVPCWEVEIGGLLPIPSGEVLIGDLLTFRERYSDERLRLMVALDRLLHELRTQYEDPQDIFQMMKYELERAAADVEAAGRAAKIEWTRRSLAVSIALASGFAGVDALPDFGWVLGVVGGIAVNVATSRTRPSHSREGDDFSYLHRVAAAVK